MVTLNTGAAPMRFFSNGSTPVNSVAAYLADSRLLENAVKSNDIESVKSFFARDSNNISYCRSVSGSVPLIAMAAESGYEEIVDFLIASKHQLPKDERDFAFGLAMERAARAGHANVVHSLLAALDKVDCWCDKGTALMAAVSGGHVLLVNSLLFYGADINAINFHGETSLTLAVSSQNVEVLHALLGHMGLDINAAGTGGFTAMELASILLLVHENKAMGGESAKTMEVAREIFHALRLAGCDAMEKSADQIFTDAYYRSRGEPDSATLRFMEAMKITRSIPVAPMSEQDEVELLKKIQKDVFESLIYHKHLHWDSLRADLYRSTLLKERMANRDNF
ncbi:MAG: ankyrin repeat domain-containing protein [Comamonas sp.]